MEQKRNLWVIPTDKPSRLWVNNLLQGKLELSEEVLPYNTAQNIYITSDEEIKEGDCYYILSTKEVLRHNFSVKIEDDGDHKKIILTTDQDLIKDGVQEISEDFLQWFVKNPSCEFVEVELKNFLMPLGGERRWWYEIIIPKEETKFEDSIENSINIMSIANSMFSKKEEPKQSVKEYEQQGLEKYSYELEQETLEEASKRAVKSGLFKEETLFIAGAKWQQEQNENKYSEEDMIEFVEWIANTKLHGYSKQLYEAMIRYKVETTKELLKLWFEQFKIKGDYERKYKVSIHQILEQFKKK